MLPPYGEPTGPRLPLPELIDAFVSGARSGSSEEAHIEDAQLLAERMTVVAVRVCPRVLLVRVDIPHTAAREKTSLEDHLTANGFRNVEPDARLGDIAAIQIAGIRGGVWDLWGEDAAAAHRELERAVLADDFAAFGGGTPAPAEGVGMTLDELLGELRVDGPPDVPPPAGDDEPNDKGVSK